MRLQELPGLVNSNTQETIKLELLSSELGSIEIDPNILVTDQIVLTKRSYGKKTACGLVATMLIRVSQNHDKNWRTFFYGQEVTF